MKLLPGQALGAGGRPRLDYRAVATLAFPFMLNSAVQAVLNATDTWFIGVFVVCEARTLDRFIAPVQERLWALARNLWWSWDHDSGSLFL